MIKYMASHPMMSYKILGNLWDQRLFKTKINKFSTTLGGFIKLNFKKIIKQH